MKATGAPKWGRMRLWSVLVSALAALTAFGAEESRSCSCVESDYGFLLADSTEVPSNLGGVPWYGPPDGTPDTFLRQGLEFSVERRDGAEWNRVAFNVRYLEVSPVGSLRSPYESSRGSLWLVEPEQGFTPGLEYRFRYRASSLTQRENIVVHVAVSSLTPFRGELRLGSSESRVGPLGVSSPNGMCAAGISAARSDLEFQLPAAWAPFRQSLLFATRVDDQFWRPAAGMCKLVPPGLSWCGAAHDRVYTDCGATDGIIYKAIFSEASVKLDPGLHRVEMVAWLPGTNLEIREHAVVDLECSR